MAHRRLATTYAQRYQQTTKLSILATDKSSSLVGNKLITQDGKQLELSAGERSNTPLDGVDDYRMPESHLVHGVAVKVEELSPGLGLQM